MPSGRTESTRRVAPAVLVVCSDTHSRSDHELTGQLLADVRAADAVIHAGDFTAPAALDAFQGISRRLHAVHGNADDPAVRQRLPPTRTVEYGGVRIVVTHRHEAGAVGLAMLGRERGADLVVSGHSHRPTVSRARDVVLVNPGSHADPRGNRPGYATLTVPADGSGENENGAAGASSPAARASTAVRGRLREPDGTLLERFTVDGDRLPAGDRGR